MATTTTTTMGQPRTQVNEVSNRRIYWGVAIAALVILAIIFATRASRNDVAPVATDSTITAPAASTQYSDSTTTTATESSAVAPAASGTTTTMGTTESDASVNAAAAGTTREGYNIDNGTMDLQNQPNDRLTNKNAANPNSNPVKK